MCVLPCHVCAHECVFAGASVHAYARVLVCCFIPRGWGWEKQVRKQQNKLRDNEESNTGTCFPGCRGRRIHLRNRTACFYDALMPRTISSLDISVNSMHYITFISASNPPQTCSLPNTHAHFFFLGSVMWPDVQVDIALKAFDWMKQCIGCG